MGARMSFRKERIVRAFGQAEGYDSHAVIQREAARRLADSIAAYVPRPAGPALEIGCGTGMLSSAMLAHWPDLQLTVTDIAPAMVERARTRLGPRASVDFAVADGEDPPAVTDGWGLILSSLAFQWFDRLDEALARLYDRLARGGWLCFATLGADTFREWRDARAAAGLADATRSYPDAGNWGALVPAGCEYRVERYLLTEQHADGFAFLRGLKAIGAATAWNDDRGASPRGLRRAVSLLEAGGCAVTYDIAQLMIRRPLQDGGTVAGPLQGNSPEGL